MKDMQQRGKPPTFLPFVFILGEMTATALRLPSGSPHFNYSNLFCRVLHSTSSSFPHSRFTGFVTRVTLRVSLVEHELPTIPKHLRSLPVFSGASVTR
jgi:hypothetical protein